MFHLEFKKFGRKLLTSHHYTFLCTITVGRYQHCPIILWVEYLQSLKMPSQPQSLELQWYTIIAVFQSLKMTSQYEDSELM